VKMGGYFRGVKGNFPLKILFSNANPKMLELLLKNSRNKKTTKQPKPLLDTGKNVSIYLSSPQPTAKQALLMETFISLKAIQRRKQIQELVAIYIF
jgi:hypothetical protein